MKTSGTGGIGLPTILFLIFMTLKLTKYIDWSWWWVTSPLWISGLSFIIVLVLMYLFIKK
jgi:hypothetical protein